MEGLGVSSLAVIQSQVSISRCKWQSARLAGLGWSEGNVPGGNVSVVTPSSAPGDHGAAGLCCCFLTGRGTSQQGFC